MKKVMLLILDGWGIGNKDNTDAIHIAETPFIDSLMSKPNSRLKTFGENVGLPEGQMGNSEVGHMNIGAGRVVWQMLVRINKSFKDESIKRLPSYQKLVHLAKKNPNRKIHLMGLVSDGGVHSSIEHLKAITRLMKEEELDHRVKVHAFTDGRDTDPFAGIDYLKSVVEDDNWGACTLSSITGRYYAMDRDKRWERTKLAYDALVKGEGSKSTDFEKAMKASYEAGETDEFIKPIILSEDKIQGDDIVFCFNFRTDRGRQISTVLTQKDIAEYNMTTLPINYFTMTEYDKTYKNVNVLFENQDLKNTLGEVLSKAGVSQLRAAETEKYPHVTFFFNGGREEPFVGEQRVMASSPKVATYDLQPEMSAEELTDKVIANITENKPGFICLNYANPDMVGHTGVFNAIVKACETVDSCAKRVIDAAVDNEYTCIVIADHGNADKAINDDGTPHTAHTTNLVPCYLIDSDITQINDGKLADIAPTILNLMGIKPPNEFDGISLF